MNFTDITKVQYSVSWNTAELAFVGVTNFNTNSPLNISDADFDLSEVANGSFTFSWENTNGSGQLDDATVFYSIEFRALIPDGATAEIVYANTPAEIIINRTASGDSNIFDPDRESHIHPSRHRPFQM